MLTEQQQAAPVVHALEDRLERSARVLRTPCGEGHIVWRSWGGTGPAIFLLHGGFGSWKHWIRNVDGLARAHRVFAADLPGLGESSTAPQPHTAPAIARYFAQAFAQLDPGPAPALVAGFSLGSSIAAHATALAGDKVAALVVLGASGMGEMWANRTGELKKLSRTMSVEEVRANIRYNLSVSMIHNPAKIDDQAIDIQGQLLKQKRTLVGMPISMSTTLFDAFDQVAGKTTMLFGEHDCYMDPDVATCLARTKERYPALHALTIKGAGHWVMYEEPEAVNAVLLEAFRRGVAG